MRKSIRLRYIGSFLIIVIIPAITFAIFFHTYSINNTNNEINRSRLSAFKQATTQINYALKEMKTIALHISGNLDSLVTVIDAFTIEENRPKIQSQLLNYEKNLPSVSNMCFYIRGEKYIFISDEKISYSTFEQSQKDNVDYIMSKFFINLNSLTAPYIYRLSQNFMDITQNKGIIAYIFPLPYLESRPHSNVVFLIKEKYFSDIFENAMGSFAGDIYFFNRFMQPVYSNVPLEEDYSALTIESAKKIKGTGLLHQEINNQKLIIMRNISEELGLTYVVAMHENEFYNRAIDTSYPLFLLIGALMILCIFFAVMMAYYNYRPIKSLIHDIIGNNFEYANVNEFDVIKNVYNRTVNEKMILSVQLDMQNRIVENQFLYKLISGKCSGIDELEYIESYTKLKFDKRNNIVIVVSLFNIKNKEQKLDRILNASDNINFPDANIYVTEMLFEQNISYVCNYNGNKDDSIRNQIADKIWNLLTSQGIGNVMIGVGSIYDSPMKIHLSYIEATAALQTALLSEEHYIFIYQKGSTPDSVDYCLSTMDKSLLIEGIQHGNEQVALSALDTIVQQIQSHCSSFIIMQLQCFDVLNMIIKLLSQECINIPPGSLNNCATFNSLTEFKEQVNAIVNFACKEIESKREIHNTMIKSKVLNFINNNYYRNDFSLELVSTSLGITKTMINAILKEDTLCSFVQYVTMLRMEEVKRQLKETDKKIQDIVNSVGYMDVPNFIRKFKNSEGLTPGQYRQLNR